MADNQDNATGIGILLDLDGRTFHYDNGYWLKIEARLVDPDDKIPHGIRYSLTLHDKSGERIIGFDNAHGIKLKRKKFGARKTTYDHKHHRKRVTNYEFDTAGKLLEDFFKEVNKFVDGK